MTSTRTRRPRRDLTPVDVTARFPSFRSGRLENWAADSRDGVWKYERIEDTNTLWAVIDAASGEELRWHGTLTAAREYTASGAAAEDLARILAHNSGDHAVERDSRCARC